MFSIYRLILALHIISVISWMAGILYLLRLFVYHTSETEAVVKQRFEVMERRLYIIITLPAQFFALAMGVIMILLNPTLLQQGWMHAKLTAVIALMGVTHYAGHIRRRLEQKATVPNSTFFRVLNEIPTLLMIAIIFLVILRPF